MNIVNIQTLLKKITNLEVCNFLITINRPAQTRNFHGPPECNGGPAGGTLARTAGFFYGRPEWATLVGLPSTTILSYVAIFAIAGAMEPWQHHFFRQRNTEWLRVTNPTQSDSHSLHLDRPRLHAFFSGARVGWAHFIAERDLSSQDQARAKENTIYPPKLFLFRKKEWESEIERERERERERESVCEGFNDWRE